MASINYKEILIDEIPIVLFSGVLDKVLQEFAGCFQDSEKISEATRVIAFPHLEETESAPLNLQMELIKLKNNEQLVKKLNNQKNLRPKKTGHVERCN